MSTRGEEQGVPWAIHPSSGIALLRVALGLLFLWVFVENLGKGLYDAAGYSRFIQGLAARSSAPSFWKDAMLFVAERAGVFAPLQAATELILGVLLFLGLRARPAATVAFLLLAALWVSEWGTAWVWELLMPVLVALTLALTPSGRSLALDAWLARRSARGSMW